ncbi:hypothetical protein JCGZ_17627 [Jatropha curcas]|uniref:Uncharacterized protein n=1 Tax=Jatropha curcas TaxID=180498 RepID=A0A067K3T0_JATCU|nr:hypothetical protein JCGZ_17627 [Jatropha curcas]
MLRQRIAPFTFCETRFPLSLRISSVLEDREIVFVDQEIDLSALYPRVKVRKHEGEEDGDLEYLSPPKGNSDLLFLEITESPYVQEKENQSDTLDLIARITKPYVPNLTPQPNPISASKANDLKVGNGNRMKISKERSLGLRKCNSEPKKKQTQNKPTASASHAIAAESSLYLRKGDLKAATASNIIAKSEGLSSKVKG